MRPLLPWPSLSPYMHSRTRNGHGLGDPLNKCKNNVFEWHIGGRDLLGSTGRFCRRGKIRSYVQTQESFVQAQAIAEGMVPPYRLVLY